MQYNIHGDNMPVVICSLDDGESMICEAGAMSWMTPNMEMETKSGGAGKLFGRVFASPYTVRAVVDHITGKEPFTGLSPVDPFCGMFGKDI